MLSFYTAGISWLLPLFAFFSGFSVNRPSGFTFPKDTISLADPTIFYENGLYYLYGTSSQKGFLVYQSVNLKSWRGPVGKQAGYALIKGDSYGTSNFWAPQLFKHKGIFYMAYAANEHIAIVEGNHPLGPFRQKVLKYIPGTGRAIDPYIFKDNDGKLYLYYVQLKAGNRIFVARLKNDLSDIDTSTIKECINASNDWENETKSAWPVCEGPTVFKHDNTYYLLYSCNDNRNINYAVGYATSKSPYGPWVKYANNPIINRALLGVNGTGHGDLFTDIRGQLYYVFHTHRTDSTVEPRKTALIKIYFNKKHPTGITVDEKSFRYLVL